MPLPRTLPQFPVCNLGVSADPILAIFVSLKMLTVWLELILVNFVLIVPAIEIQKCSPSLLTLNNYGWDQSQKTAKRVLLAMWDMSDPFPYNER